MSAGGCETTEIWLLPLSHRLKSVQYAREVGNAQNLLIRHSWTFSVRSSIRSRSAFLRVWCGTLLNIFTGFTPARRSSPLPLLFMGTGIHHCGQCAVEHRTRDGEKSHAKISNEDQQKLLDNICRAKPEQEFSRAVMQLLDKIREAEGLPPI
jgi:hypothetical protein